MTLSPDDTVVTAWAEYPSGPGWANQIVCVLVRERGGALRTECFQPTEQTSEMQILMPVSAAINAAMVGAVRRR